ncbi:MAG TPA: hypothetical protein VIY48_10100, partial [Candidatus Paceibacterota bacterium]
MQTTANTTAFIEAQQYSDFILANMHDGLLPEQYYRNVSDFPSGTTLNIKVVGDTMIQDVEEDKAMTYSPLDTSTITLSITDHVGDAWYVTDVLREDGAQVEQLAAMRAMSATRTLQEDFETKYLKVAGITAQTASSTNAINGFAHRWIADTAADNTYKIGLTEFVDMKLSFDKANVPQMGRVALVDPVVEATLNKLAANFSVDRNPQFQALLEQGMAREHKFLFNLLGWDIYTSNRLHRLAAAETITGPSGVAETAPVGSVANVFMCVLDDTVKPIMGAWRRQPKVEGGRNKDMKRDEFDV